jgi:hypothetical protein
VSVFYSVFTIVGDPRLPHKDKLPLRVGGFAVIETNILGFGFSLFSSSLTMQIIVTKVPSASLINCLHFFSCVSQGGGALIEG